VSDFYKSKPGKLVQFFSPISMLPVWNPNWGDNVKEWLSALAGKGGGGSVISTGQDFNSIITGEGTIAAPVEKLAGAAVDVGEVVGPAILGAATLADITAHNACSATEYPPAPSAPAWF
jgi:hypothetical protein